MRAQCIVLLTGTIRDNILFGQPYNSQRYAELSGLLHSAHQYLIFLKLHGNCIFVVEDGEVRIWLKLSSFLFSGGGVTEWLGMPGCQKSLTVPDAQCLPADERR